MRLSLLLSLIIFLVLFAIACNSSTGGSGNDDDDSGDGETEEPFVENNDLQPSIGIDLSTVKAFAFANQFPSGSEAPSDQTSDETSNVLLAINKDNTTTVVNVVGDGIQTSQGIPLGIHDTPKYILLVFSSVSFEGNTCHLVIIRKSDGSTSCEDILQTNNSFGSSPFSEPQTDATGDLIFVHSVAGSGDRIDSIDLSNSDQAVVSAVFSREGFLGGFEFVANSDGDVFVPAGFADLNHRIYKRDGGVTDITSEDIFCMTNGLEGQEDEFFYTVLDSAGSVLNRISKNEGDFTVSTHLEMPFTVLCLGSSARSDNRLFTSVASTNFFYEFLNTDNRLIQHNVASMSEVVALLPYEGGLVIQGKDSNGNDTLARTDLTPLEDPVLMSSTISGITREYYVDTVVESTILAPGEFSISVIEVGTDGEVLLDGLRMSDGAKITGSIPAGSTTMEIISTELPTIKQIEHITF